MDFKTFLSTIQELRHSYLMIPILLAFAFSVCFKVCNDLGLESLKTKLLIFTLVYLISLTTWLLICWWVPKTKHGVIGIYLCIKTKGPVEREKLHNEIVNRAQDLIENMNLSELINIYELNNLQASRVFKYLKPMKKFAQSKHENNRKYSSKVRRLLNATMIIDGRMSICNNNNVYYMETTSTVFHPVLVPKLQKEISKLMNLTWAKEQTVNTQDEIRGFKITTSTMMVHLLFIIGFVAYIGDDLSISTRLLEALYKSKLMDMVENENIPKKLYRYINGLLNESFGILATRYIEMGDEHNAALYLEMLGHFGKSYGYYVTKAIYDFRIMHNIQEALKSIDEASLLAGSDKSWMFSKGFLLYYSCNYNEALNVYYKAIRGSFANDTHVIDQVIEFIEGVMQREPDRSDFKFVLGLLCYKKLQNLPLAYKYLDEFVEFNYPADGAMSSRARTYLKELSKELGI